MPELFDVAVSGGGLVGMSFALAAGRAGLRVALIEASRPAAPLRDAWDTRVYAVSPGSAAFLDSFGAWSRLPAGRVTRVEAMTVQGDRAGARVHFSAYDAGLRELAFIVESGHLQQALQACLPDAERIAMYAPAQFAGFTMRADAVEVRLADGTALAARLLVGADGGASPVREQAGITVERRPYGQIGVVANFRAQRPHEGMAYQWFRRDGVLALLPLDSDGVSMVWSTGEAHARELLDCVPAELADRVLAASCGMPGRLESVSAAAGFPLSLARVSRLVAPRIALIGDAAHNVHPLAGQGVNLGFRDARELAAVLASRGAQVDSGDYGLLRRYERARREDILAMQAATDGLQKLFARDAVWLEGLRNTGLQLVDRLPPLKNFLVRHAVA